MRIFWNFSGRSGRLVDVARDLLSNHAWNSRLNNLHGADTEISSDYQIVFPLWLGREPAPVTTAEVNQRPAQISLERRVNSTKDHINMHEYRAVRGMRFVILFGCGSAALGRKHCSAKPREQPQLDVKTKLGKGWPRWSI